MHRENSEVLDCLKRGESIAALALDKRDGRLVIRDLRMEVPRQVGTVDFGGSRFLRTTGGTRVEATSWRDLHFVRCDFSNTAFFDVTISNCVFERCRLPEVGFWRSVVSTCRFVSCDMRGAALGGVDGCSAQNIRNIYEETQFEKCNLIGSAHSAELYRSCKFANCRLDNVLFLGAVFENCVFTGHLKGVEFRSEFEPGMPSNKLVGCDFREAELTDCQFIHIGLDRSMFSPDEDWIVLPRGSADWDEWGKLPGIDNLFVQYTSKILGSPALIQRSYLKRVGYTAEQIEQLVEIARTTP